MRTKRRDIFTTIRTEGNLLPMDLLQRVAEGDRNLDGLAPETYHIGKNERLNEGINRAWKRCQTTWVAFQKEYQTLPDSDAGTTLTRERWLLVLFQELAYGRLLTSKAREVGGKRYPVSHFWNHTPIHLVSFRQNLDRRTPGVAGAARLSPHGLVQEFLNRSDDHLWGMVSNGLGLRLLRDNASLTRQAYVEFDLEGMMSGEVYSDFILLFLLLHQSRVEAEQPEQCWLEQWTRAAQEQGTRALDQLRSGVEQAITALGKGFLAHPGNGGIREKLRKGELTAYNMYQQILRLVYRLIFLFVAEDRNLLLLPEATEATKRLYLDHYSLKRFRHMAGRVRGTRHADLWEGLRITFRCLYQGEPALGLNPLGGFLFSPNAMPDLNEAGLSNDALLDAVRRLSYTTEGRSLRPVDYRNLGTEELGSVYESLLELHPEVNTTAATFDLRIAAGSDRKTTGSYYTPSSLINCLLDSALEPVIENAIRKPDPEKALLELKVVDPACGSGHFLIAAAHRMAKHLAMIRTGEAEPAPEERRKAIRDVVSHCIYGVDLNPLAVELCKVALWIETLDPGKPLGFLDHHIKCGNSLVGATPELLEKGIPDDAFKPVTGDDKKVATAIRKKNRNERKWKQKDLFSGQVGKTAFVGTIEELREWGFMREDSQQAVNDKADKYQILMDDPSIRHAREAADLWTSAFFWPLTDESVASIPTEDVFRLFQEGSLELPESMRKRMGNLSRKYLFFHWHLEFPEVFGGAGGFDCVLGNPPWGQFEFDPTQVFAATAPEVLEASHMAERDRRIKSVLAEPGNGKLKRVYMNALRENAGRQSFLHISGLFPLSGKGRLNTAPLFIEMSTTIAKSSNANVGLVVPTTFAVGSFTQVLFRELLSSGRLRSFYAFDNSAGIFPDVKRSFRFGLLTLVPQSSGEVTKPADFVFFAEQISDLADPNRHFIASSIDMLAVNPNTGLCPVFRWSRDAVATIAIHRRVPVFSLEHEAASDSWSFDSLLMFMSNNLSHHYAEDAVNVLPVHEAKSCSPYDHRRATNTRHGFRALSDEEKENPNATITPRYWVPAKLVEERLKKRWKHRWLLTWQDVTDVNTMSRTLQATILPFGACGDGLPILIPHVSASDLACLLGNLNTFPIDFVARQKVGGTHLRLHIFKQLPVQPQATYRRATPWSGRNSLRAWIIERVLELTYTAWDLRLFANDIGYDGPPFRWNQDRRFLLRCELDAAFFHLYLPSTNDHQWKAARIAEKAVRDETSDDLDELKRQFPTPKDAVSLIMETFPIVKRKDEQRYGEYRTKRVILECYDAMAGAMKTGTSYQTILDPPPGPPPGSLPEWKPGHPKPKDWPPHIHLPRPVLNL